MEQITCDLIPGGKMPLLHASQYDEGREYRINLTENKQAYTLDGTELLTVSVRKGDNTLFTADIANTFGGKSYVDFVSTEQMCAVAGYNFGELSITKNNTRIGTVNFMLVCEPSPEASGLTSESEINNLNRQVHDIVVEELADNGAEETGYDNTESGLEATNVQDAIDEVNTKIENIPSVDAYTKQESDEKYATKTELSNKADVSAIPTKTSQLQNDSGFAQIDDREASASKVYSSNKVNGLLGNKASASEVENIRIGADGNTYPSAGDAVRGQLSDISDISPNLYNLTGATDGYFLNTSNNNPIANADWYYTDYIPVQSGVTYGISRPFYVNAYSSAKTFMKNAITITNVDSTWAKFTVPSDVSYIRISAQIVNKSSAMLVVGETKPSDYHPCGLILDALQFLDNSIPLSKLQGYKDNFYVVVDANGAGDYTSISDAVADVPNNSTIIVNAGDYYDTVLCESKTVFIIGVDKYKCRVWNSEGDYTKPPFYIASGCLKNLTIENVYDSSKDYSGIANTGEYAIHIDTYPVNKQLIIDNCIIKSVWNNVLGCGARNGEILEISNCTIIADKCQLSTDNCEGFNMHGGNEGDSATVIFRNNVFRNVHGANDIKFSINPNTQSQNIKVEAYFNVAEKVVNASPNFVHIQKGSYGNQSSVLNYSEP